MALLLPHTFMFNLMLLGKLVSFAGCKIIQRCMLGACLSLKRIRG